MTERFVEELNRKFAGKTVKNVHHREGDGYIAVVVEVETKDNSILFLVADSARLIYHEESPTVREHEDVFEADDCPLQSGWVPYDRRPDNPPTIDAVKLEQMEKL